MFLLHVYMLSGYVWAIKMDGFIVKNQLRHMQFLQVISTNGNTDCVASKAVVKKKKKVMCIKTMIIAFMLNTITDSFIFVK